MSKTLLKGGLVVGGYTSRYADVLIDGSRIAAVGSNLSCEEAEIIDARGKLLFPGFIDTHTHFQMKAAECVTADDFESGTAAALAGGTTVILDFTTQDKGESLMSALERWHAMADGHCYCDYGFHMSVTDWNDEVKKEIPQMTREGITSYKAYMAYPNLRVSDREIFEILQAIATENGILGTHCENGDLIDSVTKSLKESGMRGTAAHPIAHCREIEAEAIGRYLTIAQLAGTPVNIVHLSTKRGMEYVREARGRGQIVCVETCPQYFLLDESLYSLPDFEGAKYVFSPPARRMEDRETLRQALSSDEIDTIGTDHCSFNFEREKRLGIHDFSRIPNGIPGVEHRPVLMYTSAVAPGYITKEQFCRYLSENAAKEYGLYPRKGIISEGADADIVVWDPEREGIISAGIQLQNVDYTPYEGMKIKGAAQMVYLRGQLAALEGRVLSGKDGNYLKRSGADLSFR